jgi:hypothetical protein
LGQKLQALGQELQALGQELQVSELVEQVLVLEW